MKKNLFGFLRIKKTIVKQPVQILDTIGEDLLVDDYFAKHEVHISLVKAEDALVEN